MRLPTLFLILYGVLASTIHAQALRPLPNPVNSSLLFERGLLDLSPMQLIHVSEEYDSYIERYTLFVNNEASPFIRTYSSLLAGPDSLELLRTYIDHQHEANNVYSHVGRLDMQLFRAIEAITGQPNQTRILQIIREHELYLRRYSSDFPNWPSLDWRKLLDSCSLSQIEREHCEPHLLQIEDATLTLFRKLGDVSDEDQLRFVHEREAIDSTFTDEQERNERLEQLQLILSERLSLLIAKVRTRHLDFYRRFSVMINDIALEEIRTGLIASYYIELRRFHLADLQTLETYIRDTTDLDEVDRQNILDLIVKIRHASRRTMDDVFRKAEIFHSLPMAEQYDDEISRKYFIEIKNLHTQFSSQILRVYDLARTHLPMLDEHVITRAEASRMDRKRAKKRMSDTKWHGLNVPERYLSPPIEQLDISRLAEIAGEDISEVILDNYRAYRQRYLDTYRDCVEKMKALREGKSAEEMPIEEIATRFRAFRRILESEDLALFETIATIAKGSRLSQQVKLEYLRSERRRKTYMIHFERATYVWFNAIGRVDVAYLLRQYEITSGTKLRVDMENVWSIDGYEAMRLKIMQRIDEMSISLQMHTLSEDHEAAGEIWDSIVQEWNALVTLNEDTMETIRGTLDDHASRDIYDLYLQTGFPGAYTDPGRLRSLKIPDNTTSDQRAAIHDIIYGYYNSYQTLTESIIRLQLQSDKSSDNIASYMRREMQYYTLWLRDELNRQVRRKLKILVHSLGMLEFQIPSLDTNYATRLWF